MLPIFISWKSPGKERVVGQLTWVTGVVLAVLTAPFDVTGYSLP